jgi:hypothetical protein
VSSAREGAVRGLLSALWSFLQHPAAAFEEHLIGLEERLKALEAGAEHRLEEDFRRAVRARIAAIEARLETVKNRVVEELKRELHRVVLILALALGCAALALLGLVFGLMAAWTYLKGVAGAVAASLLLTIIFLLASLLVFAVLRSVLRRRPDRL